MKASACLLTLLVAAASARHYPRQATTSSAPALKPIGQICSYGAECETGVCQYNGGHGGGFCVAAPAVTTGSVATILPVSEGGETSTLVDPAAGAAAGETVTASVDPAVSITETIQPSGTSVAGDPAVLPPPVVVSVTAASGTNAGVLPSPVPSGARPASASLRPSSSVSSLPPADGAASGVRVGMALFGLVGAAGYLLA